MSLLSFKMKAAEIISTHKRILWLALQALVVSIFCASIQLAYTKGKIEGVNISAKCHEHWGTMKYDGADFYCLD